MGSLSNSVPPENKLPVLKQALMGHWAQLERRAVLKGAPQR